MGRQNLRKALCTNHQHQKSVTAIWGNVQKSNISPKGPNRAPLIKLQGCSTVQTTEQDATSTMDSQTLYFKNSELVVFLPQTEIFGSS